ncbi:uncharacterized protein LOC116418345 [Nasonia vitripennis]|uniref:Uncharacterized protein n=1 Tax=Nasonia vitripennis TaxID=7425 RepID=A0A7M7QPZ6_NASVI|nr:uncharacterized protein LOC116418111 [Nasonia vitripennis]XP_031789289.1 uncharacterized protein LOC116418345 [Nasonia vitripennis]
MLPSEFHGKCQRKTNNNFEKGLAYDNEFYRIFIEFLKINRIISETTEEPKLQVDQIKSIVLGIYKNWHISSYKAVEKFVTKYFEIIKEDIKDYDVNMVLLAPEYKAIDVYMLNLIITCVMLCPEEFGNCIFKGEKITHVSKEMILTKMYRNFSKSDMNKLNNTLDKYNLYLQKKSIDFVNNVLKQRALKHIQERQPFVRLETQKSQEDSQSSFESQSFLETRSAVVHEKDIRTKYTYLATTIPVILVTR